MRIPVDLVEASDRTRNARAFAARGSSKASLALRAQEGSAMRRMVVVSSVCVVLAAATAALAEERPESGGVPFAGAGQVALGGYGTVSRNSTSQDGATYTTTGVTVAPLADVFVLDRVSVGAGLTFGYMRSQSDANGTHADARTVLARPTLRLGWYLPLGEKVGFWPVVSLGYGYASSDGTSTTGSVTTGGSSHAKSSAIGLDAQLVFHVADRWFVRAVPAAGYVSSGSGAGIGAVGASTGLLGGFLVGLGGWM
jgi:hypothetical protein